MFWLYVAGMSLFGNLEVLLKVCLQKLVKLWERTREVRRRFRFKCYIEVWLKRCTGKWSLCLIPFLDSEYVIRFPRCHLFNHLLQKWKFSEYFRTNPYRFSMEDFSLRFVYGVELVTSFLWEFCLHNMISNWTVLFFVLYSTLWSLLDAAILLNHLSSEF
jgi:hypothetical protein